MSIIDTSSPTSYDTGAPNIILTPPPSYSWTWYIFIIIMLLSSCLCICVALLDEDDKKRLKDASQPSPQEPRPERIKGCSFSH
jgi:hypothetical protein